MPIVTFTSDYGWKDPDTAVVRGMIYSEMLRSGIAAPVVDVSHDVSPRNHQEAAYILRGAYSSFPKKSVHVVLVDNMASQSTEVIAVEIDDHFFLALNHGGLSLIRPDLKITNMVQIELKNRLELVKPESIISAAAIHLLNNGTLTTLGKNLLNFQKLQTTHPEIKNEKTAIIHIKYVDHYGQLITNASEKWLSDWTKNRTVFAIARGRKINNWISNREDMKDSGTLYMRINNFGFLEIGLVSPGKSSSNTASSLLGISEHDPIELQIK